ncbi:hypothetical protein, partial [Neptuniibacter sp. CAU 1671]|uniref:hypothetical protein n=1 Tax=Neptuniibacter sp. CAU 1671 TaxID=3032593 RepID=UPI0023DADB53
LNEFTWLLVLIMLCTIPTSAHTNYLIKLLKSGLELPSKRGAYSTSRLFKVNRYFYPNPEFITTGKRLTSTSVKRTKNKQFHSVTKA